MSDVQKQRPYLPKVRIEVQDGVSILTRVFMDDVEVRGVLRVRFDTGVDIGQLDIAAALELEGTVEALAAFRPLTRSAF